MERRKLEKAERDAEEKKRREDLKASSNPFAKNVEEPEAEPPKKYGKIDFAIRAVDAPPPMQAPSRIGKACNECFPSSGESIVLADSCSDRRLLEKVKREKEKEAADREKKHLKDLGIGDDDDDVEEEKADSDEEEGEVVDKYADDGVGSTTFTTTVRAVVSKQQFLTEEQARDEGSMKGPTVYYACSQSYLLEESAAYDDSVNKNSSGGSITIGAVFYDAYPATEAEEARAKSREDEIARFEAAASKSRPLCDNLPPAELTWQCGTASGASMWPVARSGNDGGCELCHNEYGNISNTCSVAVRQRILALREMKEKMETAATRKKEKKEQQHDKRRHSPLTGAKDTGDGEEKEENDDEDLLELTSVPRPKDYEGSLEIITVNSSMPPPPPRFPWLLAMHSPQPNEEFPFNFGVRLRKNDPLDPRYHDTIYFHCLASDKCRACSIDKRKRSGTAFAESGILEYNCTAIEPTQPLSVYRGTRAGIPIIAYKEPFVDLIVKHLEANHYNMLLQFGFYKKAVTERHFADLTEFEED